MKCVLLCGFVVGEEPCVYFLFFPTTFCFVFDRYVVVERRWRMSIEVRAVICRNSDSSFQVVFS